MKKVILVTGSAGLIGSECVRFFSKKNYSLVGIDNDMRRYFFGKEASTNWNLKLLKKEVYDYEHYGFDIRNQKKVEELFKKYKPSLIIHAAAQPSHDWATREPLTDFSVNSTGTLILLEALRHYTPDSAFAFLSTNKVYGDLPNQLPLIENKTRYEILESHNYFSGINESMNLDQSTHSIFGVSKVSADLMVQEYGRYFGLKTVCFRGGCLTGPSHSGTKLHGFLSYLVNSIATKKLYTIFGYKGKQVRDNIHSYDVANAIYQYYKRPRKGEVYNLGGSRHSNISILEAIDKIEKRLRTKAKVEYDPKNRKGDHKWYISDVSKFKRHYPKWNYKYDIDSIIFELCDSLP